MTDARRDAMRSSAPVTASGGRSWCSAMLRAPPSGAACRLRGRTVRRRRRRRPVARGAPRRRARARGRPARAVAAAVRPRRRADRARSGTTGTPAASAERSRRAREHHRPVERSSPVEQHAFGTAEDAGRRDEQHRPLLGPRRRHGRSSDRSCQRVELPPRPRGVTPQQRMARGTARERQPLRRVVERQGRAPARCPDHRTPASRQHVQRLAGASRRVAAGVADAQLGMEHGGAARRARPQAEVHVLREQMGRRVERAELAAARPSCRRGTRRSPSRRCASPPRGRARADRARTRGSSGACSGAASSAPIVPGSGCAERWTRPSASSNRGACSASVRARTRATIASRLPSSSSQSGFNSTQTSWRARSTPASLAAP